MFYKAAIFRATGVNYLVAGFLLQTAAIGASIGTSTSAVVHATFCHDATTCTSITSPFSNPHGYVPVGYSPLFAAYGSMTASAYIVPLNPGHHTR